MLSEFALSPALFRPDAYESSAVADVCLGGIFRPLLEECVVRNFRNGEWSQFTSQQNSLHIKAKELLKKLASKNRLASDGYMGASSPTTDEDWEKLAIESHRADPLTGIIFNREAKEHRYVTDQEVSCPERLNSTPFWRDRPNSCRISRTLGEYRRLTDPLSRWANLIAFIDPHLDPESRQYQNFLQILLNPFLLGRVIKPRIEIHRVAWRGVGNDRRPVAGEIEASFHDKWSQSLRAEGLSIEVYLWDDFHDRFLTTNLIGMNWSNGFDVTNDPAARVTVSRLDRTNLDDLQKEFGDNSVVRKLIRKFKIGVGS